MRRGSRRRADAPIDPWPDTIDISYGAAPTVERVTITEYQYDDLSPPAQSASP